MEIKKFKMVADFNIWSLSHDDEIYTITTEDGEELFDVIEEDFLTMVDEGIVNHEGCYYLLNHPTEEQIREYAARWGIKWKEFDPDCITRIAIIDHDNHRLFVEDIPEMTFAKYNYDEQAYIDDNYTLEHYSWDYITDAEYFPADNDGDPMEIDFAGML